MARKCNKDLLLAAGCEEMIGSERIGSHAGIVTSVSESPCCLMQIDEMGRFFETMKDPRKAPHLYNCATVMMQLYTSSDSVWKADAYADAKKVKTIDQPHLVIYGTATPDSFWGSLSTNNIGEGLMGRLLAFPGRGYEVRPKEPTAGSAPPEALRDAVRQWAAYRPGSGNLGDAHPSPAVVPHTDEAGQRYREHILAIRERHEGEGLLRCALWARSGEKAGKLALLHACSRARGIPEVIRLEDVEFGIALANWLTRYLLRGCGEYVSENENEAKLKRVLRMLTAKPMTRNELTRRTPFLTARERTAIMADLIQGGTIEFAEVPTKGRSKVVFRRKQKAVTKVSRKIDESRG
jgi:hypothetical protein